MRSVHTLLAFFGLVISLGAAAEPRAISSIGRLESENGLVQLAGPSGGGPSGAVIKTLDAVEVEFIMEMSMILKRSKTGLHDSGMNPALDENRAGHFLESLYAIARADGTISAEELDEIEAIALEFGLAKT